MQMFDNALLPSPSEVISFILQGLHQHLVPLCTPYLLKYIGAHTLAFFPAGYAAGD